MENSARPPTTRNRRVFFGSTVWNVVCSSDHIAFLQYLEKRCNLLIDASRQVASRATNRMFLITFCYVQCSASYHRQVLINTVLLSRREWNYSGAHMRL
jgi:hypothetical protein